MVFITSGLKALLKVKFTTAPRLVAAAVAARVLPFGHTHYATLQKYKLGFIELFRAKQRKVSTPLFSKSARHPTRVALFAYAEAKSPCLKKRHGGVRGTPHLCGSPSYAILFFGFYPLFSLWQKAQRKKLGKKEHAER